MATFLFNELIFGPIKSRRLGRSLGINLLPTSSKFCNFNCIYCECGWNPDSSVTKPQLPTSEEIISNLERNLIDLTTRQQKLDAITFAGNGEPTLHPNFPAIVDGVIELRNQYFPSAKTAILSNGTKLKIPLVAKALKQLDQCIIKLDAGDENLFRQINQAVSKKSLHSLVQDFVNYDGELIIQSLFLKGNYQGKEISNVHPEAVQDWLSQLKLIKANQIMIYTLDRDTAATNLQKASEEELNSIKRLVEQEGMEVYAGAN